MKHEIELQEHSIVAVGALNPAIFQPAWFAAEGLITSGEAQAAKVQIISTQAAFFQVDWLNVRVLPDRFVVATENEAFYPHLRDLVASSFSKLSHTPITALGINYSCHYRFEDATQWKHVSDELAPKCRWSRLLDNPEMRSLTMGSSRPTGPNGYLNIKIEPSVRVEHGIFIETNNHYDVNEDGIGCRPMLNVLLAEWKKTFEEYKDVLKRVFPDD